MTTDARAQIRRLLLEAAKQRSQSALTLKSKEGSVELFAPYSPSPDAMIEAVWQKMASAGVALGCDDLIVDLGCGDGRWLLSAVRKYGCRALGIELDDALVQRANAQVQACGLDGRISIVRRDIMEVDISPARLVVVYAFAESLPGIGARLQLQLGVTASVLSVGFQIPGWQARWSNRTSGLRWYWYDLSTAIPCRATGEGVLMQQSK
ncbi:TPA: hypothetical protein N0F65_007807 [Lagenidium giganteum]|uniref:Methyltransferase domain-containing protein n=1 Tax=Lagenidium giganteum TaxID=4803 RepID=A0AAV2Z350_9STRA|nr:TPA: hypothetical protein N0F65_007807 [Lagenidium giganteum]